MHDEVASSGKRAAIQGRTSTGASSKPTGYGPAWAIEEEDDTDDSGGEEADDSEDGSDDSLPNSGYGQVGYEDFCEEMNLIVAHAPCDPNDDDEEEERIHRQCCLAFECSAEDDHVPKAILQFQSGDFDLWEPESSWVGEHGRRTAGIWAILDSLRWG